MFLTYYRDSKSITTHYLLAFEHRHINCEFLIALEGEALSVANDKEKVISYGKVLFLNTNVVHEIKNVSHNHRHRDIYISKEDLYKICESFFDLDFYNYLTTINEDIEIKLSKEEFVVIANKSHELELKQNLSSNQIDSEVIQRCIMVIVIELLAALYKDLHLINEHYNDKLTSFLEKVRNPNIFSLPIVEIISLSNYSRVHFERLFKSNYGYSFKTYVNDLRLNYANELLLSTDKSISEIALTVGFQSESHFIQLFKQYSGYTPLQYRKK